MKAEKEFTSQSGIAHWSEAQMLDHLYGLDAPAGLREDHLHDCPECAARWSALTDRRAGLLAVRPVLNEDRLRAQRIAVFDRIEKPRPRGIFALVPAAATALLLVLGISLQAPPPAVETQTAAVLSQSDRELFSEVAALMEEDVPRAADPFNSLFESSTTMEVQ